MVSIAILGLGGRGGMYGMRISGMTDAKVVAVADINKSVTEKLGNAWHIPKENRFYSDTDFFSHGKLADAVIICTQDKDHYRHAKAALDLGYHVVLEKPIPPEYKQCEELEAYAKEKGLILFVCYVLRYSTYFRKFKELIDSGVIGDVVQIRHNENVKYSHFARSYGRGAWKSEKDSSPFIMAKCSHDMDLMYWWSGARTKYLNSFGDLRYFKKENFPTNASSNCEDCINKRSCPFEAYKTAYRDRYFIDRFFGGKLRSKKIRAERLKNMQKLGRDVCIFDAGNDVTDWLSVNAVMENGVNCVFTSGAFHYYGGRDTVIMGTKGEISGNERSNCITVRVFGGKKKRYNLWSKMISSGHAGGDAGVIKAFVGLLNGRDAQNGLSTISEAMESQRMCIAAEYSRKNNGETVTMDEFFTNYDKQN